MKIIFLGGKFAEGLAKWLEEQGENIIYKTDTIALDDMQQLNPKFIISYNYRYILSQEILDFVQGNAINLHIALLPYNKGAHPNVWSFLEGTPSGVTIHYIDKGVDTGDIIIQRPVHINEEKETLKSSYDILHDKIQLLFKENWDRIKFSKISRYSQEGKGSTHFRRDATKFKFLIQDKFWDISIRELKERYNNFTVKTLVVER